MEIKEIQVSHHGRCVTGDLYCPEGNGTFPLVIMSHGFSGHKSDFTAAAEYFAGKGIACYIYTFCGGSLRREGDFPTTSMSVMTEKEDLLAVIDAALAWECIDTENIFLFGASQGGLVSALAAEERIDKIKAMTLLYPAFCIAEDWTKRFPKKEDIPEELDFLGMQIGKVYFMDVHNVDFYENIGKFEKPILVMHGDRDSLVPFSYSERLKAVYQNMELVTFEGEEHGFTPEGDQKMTEMTCEFIKKQL